MTISRDVLRQLAHLVRPLQTRIANSIARAVVQLVSDEKRLQMLQLGVLADEDADDGERFQQYGFSSVPHVGAEAVVVFPGGDRGHPLVIAVDDRRHRPTGGEAGEVVIYTDEGDTIRLGRGNIITITTTGTVNVEAPTVNLGPGAAALTPLDGLVNGTAIDSLTGLTQFALGNASAHVRGKK